MIIKEITHKGVGGSKRLIEYLLRYCARDTSQSRSYTAQQKAHAKLLLVHNIRGRSKSIEGLISAFKANARSRKDQRKNMTQVHHTILSFAPKSRQFLDNKKLRTITREYIKLRGSDNLYCAVIHNEKRHCHVHLAMSSADLSGLKANRISKKQFAELKQKLTEFQKEKFPELSDSLPQHGLTKSGNVKDNKLLEKWLERLPSRKKELADILRAAHANSKSLDHFLELLQKERIEPYYRAGKLTGISNGAQKYRFKSLGFDHQISGLVSQKNNEEKTLNEILQIRARSKEKDLSNELERTLEIESALEKNNQGLGESFPIAIQQKMRHLHGGLQSLAGEF